MNAIIISGKKIEKDKYLKNLISTEGIPSYNVNRYSQPLKIADIRDIIRQLSISTEKKRIFIFDNSLGFVSQNALLKTLEELADDTYIVFAGETELIPTVISRCKVIHLDSKREIEDIEEMGLFVNALVDKDLGKALACLDVILANYTVEGILIILREILISQLDTYRKEDCIRLVSFLKFGNEKYALVRNNNLNLNLMLEALTIKSCENRDGKVAFTTG